MLTARGKLSNRFGYNLTDELIEDSNALLVAGIFPRHLHIAFREYLLTDFDSVNKGNKGITIKGFNIGVLFC